MSQIESSVCGSQLSRTRRPNLPANRRGAVLPFVAVSMVAFMGVLILALDGGNLQRQKRMAQMAADAGAYAGAIEKYRKRTDGTDSVRASAFSETKRNGYENGAGGVVVNVNIPTSGNFVGDQNYVEVIVTKTMPTLFAGFFGFASVTVRARAVGGVGADTRTCIYTLDPTGSKSLSADGGVLSAGGCSIVVNSNAGDALFVKNNGAVNATGGTIAVTGNVDISTTGGGGSISGSVSTGVPRTSDPFAGLYDFTTVLNTCDQTFTSPSQGNQTLNPGTVCGDIDIQNGVTNLNPGFYIMRGGSLRVRANATLAGSGVTFLMTKDAAGNYGNVHIESNAIVQLTACTTYDAILCPLPGFLFYQGPNAPLTGINSCNGSGVGCNYFNSSSGSFLNGTLYFPTQAVEFKSGGTTATFDGGVIANQLLVASGTSVTFNPPTGGSPYSPLKRATIVE